MTSFFIAMTYAYLERHGLAARWFSSALGLVLTINTCLLVASSLALERAREFLRLRRVAGVLRWLATALTFGLAFLAGQAFAWWTLFRSGVYLAGHPDSGFFFLVTAAHAAHLLLALALLAWTFSRAWRGRLVPDRPLLLDLTAIFWHMLDLTWIYLWLVLLFYR